MFSWYKLSRITILIILCLYLLLPSGLSTTDAWYSAASIRYCSEIFRPHHLLYNALGLAFTWISSKADFDVLASMKVMNALFAFLVLIVIQEILFSFRFIEKQVVIISCAAGLTFSILRFATENETYIVPLFFALLASLNWVKFINGRQDRYALYSGLSAATAVLFHQIYIFWWLGLLTGLIIGGRKKAALLYSLVSLIGPVIYLIIIMTTAGGSGWNSVNSFILGDFKSDATLGISFKGVALSFINLLRSFIQIHGYIFNMVRHNLLLAVPGIISLVFVLLALTKLPGKIFVNISSKFTAIHILIIILQFLFAVFSFGNAKFMVMIPVLIIIIVPFISIHYEKFILRILVALFLWNISYGIIPLHNRSKATEQFLCEAALSGKDIIVIASDDQLLKSMIYYETGEEDRKNILKSPASSGLKGEKPGMIAGRIDSAIKSGAVIFTDCLDKKTISRQSILEGNQNRDFFCNYRTTLIKSWDQVTGTRSIYKVEGKF